MVGFDSPDGYRIDIEGAAKELVKQSREIIRYAQELPKYIAHFDRLIRQLAPGSAPREHYKNLRAEAIKTLREKLESAKRKFIGLGILEELD